MGLCRVDGWDGVGWNRMGLGRVDGWDGIG